jgi:alpha-1,3-rhamnosyl/mannosyltransferase
VTIHDVGFLHFPGDYPPAVVQELSASLVEQESTVDLVICDSAATEADLVATHAGYRGRTRVVPLGIDSAWFESPNQDAIRETLLRLGITQPYLLHVGALVPRKDLGTLVRAWLLLREENPELALVLAGPDAVGWKSDYDKLRDLARSASDGLHLPGYIDDVSARHLMSGAQTYVLTSKLEGFGLPVLEAMAAGVSVVSSRISAVEEVASVTVEYARVGDPESFATAVSNVLKRPDPDRIEAARQRARELSWLRCAELTLDCYRRL